jgi:hypothetical protein
MLVYNPLENNMPSQEIKSEGLAPYLLFITNLLAALLILTGLFILAFLLREIYALFQQPSAYPFLLDIKQAIENKELFSQTGLPPFIIGEGGATIIALVALLLFLSMVISIAVRLVRDGAQILSLPFTDKTKPPKPRADT